MESFYDEFVKLIKCIKCIGFIECENDLVSFVKSFVNFYKNKNAKNKKIKAQ